MDDFRAMTLREVQICLRQIVKRNSQKNRFEAAIHGVKLDSNGDEEGDERAELSEEKSAEIDNTMRALAMQKQMEMKDGGR